MLHVVFPRPRLFFGDPSLRISLDDEAIYDGSFKAGVHEEIAVTPGAYELATVIEVGAGLVRCQTWTVEIGDAEAYTATLRYSRLWGNFTADLRVEPGRGR